MGRSDPLKLRTLRNWLVKSRWLRSKNKDMLTRLLDVLEREFYERNREIGFKAGARRPKKR